ncbi:PAS domain S-box protein [Waterburya agarophytonicola K14]|uniref:histidine kinase n=1 Tax=Waterburya agarophytonicola KI4 TaxID=2874699 RepID=A0A964BNR9_9CYAN|nr:PAS domain S-box protein [Waterburya agarophytonicola]MCC0175547.1 PAS domain S-box protein [Waterburya agarophytonicola KI4]
MKVRHQLLLSYLFISLLGGIAGFLGVKAINNIQQKFERVVQQTIPVKNELNNLQRAINNLTLCTDEVIFLQQQQQDNSSNQTKAIAQQKERELLTKINDWYLLRNEYLIALGKYENLVLKFFPEEKEYLLAIRQSSQKVWHTAQDLIIAQQKQDYDQVFVLKQQSLRQAYQDFNQVIKQAFTHEDIELQTRNDSLNLSIHRYRQIILGFTLLGLLLALAIAWLISRYILRSLENLQVAAIAIGMGNLDTRLQTAGKSEFDILARTFNKMAEDLQQANAYTLSISESLTESLVVISPKGIIQSVNQATCNLLGYSRVELMGKPPQILLAQRDSWLGNLTIDYLGTNGAISNVETTYQSKSNTEICVLFSASILVGNQGKQLGLVYVAQNITNLKQVEKDNALLAKALEHVDDAIEITDSQANYLYVNPAFTRMTGYTSSEVIGKTPGDLFRSGQHSQDFYDQIFATVQQGKIWRGLMVSKRHDKTQYDQEVTLSPILNHQGLLTHIVGVKRDISDRLKAEQALQKSEERLDLVLWGSKDGFWDWNILENQVFYSTRWKQMRGFAEEEIGNDVEECTQRIHPDDVNTFTQALEDHIAQKTPTFAIEYRTLCKDGSYIWVLDRGQAFWDETGKAIRMTGSETDITQQKQIEATLREAERRWRSLLESVQLLVVSLNSLGQVEYVNPFFLALTGYQAAEVIGKDWFTNFLPHQEQEGVQDCFVALLQQNFQPHYQNAILTKSGQERAIAWNNTLLQNEQGATIGTMSIGQDITERQMMEKTKDEFISVVSHELRTPLASIQGGLNLISSGLLEPESAKGRQVIEIVTENADRLVLLVNDILELERLKLGKVKLLLKICDAAELINKAKDLMQLLANRSGINLSVSPQPIKVNADGDRIIQVLTNLISNGIKFSPEGSTISLTVELQVESQQALFKVKDRGRGIPRDKLDSIFERFQQVDASDSRKKGGTGLGLAICRSIIEQHGGKIWVESILEVGSIFCFTLPLKLEEYNHDS